MSKPTAPIFVLCCLVFWAAVAFVRFRWSSRFFDADYRHIYNHGFFAAFVCIGLLSKLHLVRRVGSAALWGAVWGFVSSFLSILFVAVTRPGGLQGMFGMGSSNFAEMLGMWLLMCVWLGGPLLGVAIALSFVGIVRGARISEPKSPA
jgi:hypothetical protein